ncbi:MAG: MFS transporter, partial [Nitrospinaceae bacterium]
MFGFEPNQKAILHLTWMAFFLTFAAWFNLAPFNTTLMATEGLTEYQVRMLMVANVALTIPARVFIGSLVDRFGPKRVFVWILLLAAGASFLFAAARTFNGLLASRLMMGVVGAGFVVGIKIIADWFPPQKMGTAQGLYAGWGNFGAAAAAFSLPPLAAFYSLDMGWRVAAGVSGLLCLIWSGVYHLWARDVPATVNPLRLGLEHSIPVSSRRDLWLQMILLGPVYAAMGMLFWRLAEAVAPPLGSFGLEWAWVGIGAAYIWHAWVCFRFNQERLQKPPL